MHLRHFILLVGILAACAHSAFAVKCYLCESENYDNCGEKFNSQGVLLNDCSKVPPPRHLMRILGEQTNATGCAIVKAEKDGNPVIIRSCYFGDINNTKGGCSPNPAEINLKYKSCEVCSTDSCNGSNIAGPVVLLHFISSIIFGLLAKYCNY